ncbi:MAG: 2-C-methyl-D-erythritol 4-phosphate cytidylyltransferase [Thermoguttaceae bacterium]|jgi:2-C-methyl-D-erythritol 4-phosphate cytidylyltransferase
MPKFAVIFPAAGQGTRFAAGHAVGSFREKKPFVFLAGKAVWLWSAERFARHPDVMQMILVTSPEDADDVRRFFESDLRRLGVEVVAGGKERCLSVENGLRMVSPQADYVAIHDAARPCVSARTIEAVFRAAIESRAAIPAVPIFGTVKRSRRTDEGFLFVDRTVPRDLLWEAQTPQVFETELYRTAIHSRHTQRVPTDDAELLETIGVKPRLVPGERTNIKITVPEDLIRAESVLRMLGDIAE